MTEDGSSLVPVPAPTWRHDVLELAAASECHRLQSECGQGFQASLHLRTKTAADVNMANTLGNLKDRTHTGRVHMCGEWQVWLCSTVFRLPLKPLYFDVLFIEAHSFCLLLLPFFIVFLHRGRVPRISSHQGTKWQRWITSCLGAQKCVVKRNTDALLREIVEGALGKPAKSDIA